MDHAQRSSIRRIVPGLPLALLAACAGVDGGGDPAGGSAPTPPAGALPAAQLEVPANPAPVPVPRPAEERSRGGRGATGEVPEPLIAEMRRDLQQRLGAAGGATAAVEIAEAVTWPDGSLGCARPGEMYTMALVPGYRVVFRAGERSYAYHASERGHFVYCASPQPPAAGDLATR